MGIILRYNFGTLFFGIFGSLQRIRLSKGGTLGWSDGGYLPDRDHRGNTVITRFIALEYIGIVAILRQICQNLMNFGPFWAVFGKILPKFRGLERVENGYPVLTPPPCRAPVPC